MDLEAQRRLRREELEAKKKRLEELKKSRLERDTSTQVKKEENVDVPANSPVSNSALLDSLLGDSFSKSSSSLESTLGRMSIHGGASSGRLSIDRAEIESLTATAKSLDRERLSIRPPLGSLEINNRIPSPLPQAVQTPPQSMSSSQFRAEFIRERLKKLKVVSNISTAHIVTMPPEMYEKSIQTDDDALFDNDVAFNGDSPQPSPSSKKFSKVKRNFGGNDTDKTPTKLEKHQNSNQHPQAQPQQHRPSISSSAELISPGMTSRKEFSEAELSNILSSSKFSQFLHRSSRIVERGLAISTSPVIDNFLIESSASHLRKRTGLTVNSLSCIFNYLYTLDRPVMDIQLCTHHGELIVVSYGARSTSTTSKTSSSSSSSTSLTSISNEDSPGLVIIWSLMTPNRPEFVLISSSPVLSARFLPESTHLVIGACYSGQLLLWDLQSISGASGTSLSTGNPTLVAKSSSFWSLLPLYRSGLSMKCHKHPVFCMEFMNNTSNMLSVSSIVPNNASSSSSIGSNSQDYEVISLSTDGLLCEWEVPRINEPTQSVAIATSSSLSMVSSLSGGSSTSGGQSLMSTLSKLGHSSASSMSGGSSGASNVKIAASGLGVNACSMTIISGGSSYRQQYVVIGFGSGHLAVLEFPCRNDEKMDLLDAHNGMITSISRNGFANHNTCRSLLLTSSMDWTVKLWDARQLPQLKLVCEFSSSNYDYVVDVKWCPSNPYIFASVSSSGQLCLYDLRQSFTEAILHENINELTATLESSSYDHSSMTSQHSSQTASRMNNNNHTTTHNSHHGILHHGLPASSSSSSGSGNRTTGKSVGGNAAAITHLAWLQDGSSLFVSNIKGEVFRCGVQESLLARQSNDDLRFERNFNNTLGHHST